jgi:TonB family protein
VNISAPTEGWTTARLVLGAAVLTVVQALVVSRLGQVPKPIIRPPSDPVEAWLVWDPVLVAEVFAGVPQSRLDIFGRDPLDAFQKVAVSALPPPRYRSTEWREPTLWLTNPVAWSGIRPVPAGIGPIPSDSTRPAFPQSGVRNLAPTNTLVEVTGDLVARAWKTAPVTRPWPGTEQLGSTRLDLAVNPQGWVILVEVAESSGSREADELARGMVSKALFQPDSRAGARPEFGVEQLSWGTVLVHWSTQPTVR